jgi:hypothetical protein
MNIPLSRLKQQRIAEKPFAQPDEAVAWLGAMQAQDYLGTLWAIGLRTTGATEQNVEQALAERRIVRTWPMRGTLHVVAAQDVRWMLKLLTPRVIAQTAGRYRQLELDEVTFARSKEIFVKALRGGKQLTRDELYQCLEHAGIATAGQRGYHLLVRSAQDRLICFGAPDGKQQTFVLLDEWVPQTPDLTRDEALAELARRYFTSRGPATINDFTGWSGLTVADAKRGVEAAWTALTQETIDDRVYWLSRTMQQLETSVAPIYALPGFDEYVLGYKDRSAVLDPAFADRICPGGNGVFFPTIVSHGHIVGTWKRVLKKNTVEISMQPFHPLREAEVEAFAAVAQRYGTFLGLPIMFVEG